MDTKQNEQGLQHFAEMRDLPKDHIETIIKLMVQQQILKQLAVQSKNGSVYITIHPGPNYSKLHQSDFYLLIKTDPPTKPFKPEPPSTSLSRKITINLTKPPPPDTYDPAYGLCKTKELFDTLLSRLQKTRKRLAKIRNREPPEIATDEELQWLCKELPIQAPIFPEALITEVYQFKTEMAESLVDPQQISNKMAINREFLSTLAITFTTHPTLYPEVRNYHPNSLKNYEDSRLISPGSTQIFQRYMQANIHEQRDLLESQGAEVIRLLVELINGATDNALLVRKALVNLDGILQDENSRVHFLFTSQAGGGIDLVALLNRVLNSYDRDIVAIESAAHILSIFLSEAILHPPNAENYQNYGVRLMDYLVNGGMEKGMSIDGVNYCLLPLFKVQAMRLEFLRMNGISRIIVRSFDERSGQTQAMYATICNLWMLTFDKECYKYFIWKDYNLIQMLINEIRRNDHEKILRVTLNTMKVSCIQNLIQNAPETVETMIENQLVIIIDNLAQRVIKDKDLVELIRELGDQLQDSVRILSSYEKWLVELEKGKLTYGVTHTENFWKENARNLEHDKFVNLQKLISLLQSEDLETVRLALFDIGEFARFHPYGKPVCNKLGAKLKAMALLQHGNNYVREAALLCVQKIMLNNWQGVMG